MLKFFLLPLGGYVISCSYVRKLPNSGSLNLNPNENLYMNILNQAVSTISNGGVILYPTDTTWALGCDATNRKSVDRILSIHSSSFEFPMEIMVASIQMLHQFVEVVHPRLETLLVYHRRPLTVIYDHCRNIAPNAMKDGKAAIRVTHCPFCQDLIRSVGKPLIAVAAADVDGHYPANLEDVDVTLRGKVDLVMYEMEGRPEQPAVIVALNERAELCFLRH